MQPPILLQALNGRDLLLSDFADIRVAGANGNAIEKHSAGATLALAAAVFCSGEVQVIAQNAEQAPGTIRVDLDFLPIYLKCRYACHNEAPNLLSHYTRFEPLSLQKREAGFGTHTVDF